jgi:hypothetical protein
VYPESNSSTKGKRRDSKASKASHGDSASSGEDDDQADKTDDGGDGLAAQPIQEEAEADAEDLEEPASATSTKAAGSGQSSRIDSSTPSVDQRKSATPMTEDSATSQPQPPVESTIDPRPAQRRASASVVQSRRWAELPQDITFYLNYHRTNITRYHYVFKFENDNFLQTTFLEIAIRSEPLMYAVAGFAAYIYAVGRGDGKIGDFLGFYNKSVTALRLSIAQGHKPTVATLLTILQLAMIEVRPP